MMNTLPKLDASDSKPTPAAKKKETSPAEQNAAHAFEHTLHAIVQAHNTPPAMSPTAPTTLTSGHEAGTGSGSGTLNKAAAPARTPAARGLAVSAAEAMIAHLAPANTPLETRAAQLLAPTPHFLKASQMVKLPAQTAAVPSLHGRASPDAKSEPEHKAEGPAKGLSPMTALLTAAQGLEANSGKPADPLSAVAPPAPPPPIPAAALTALSNDALLRGNLMPHSARLLVSAGDAGDLSLQLRVRDGQADLRVEGRAAHLLLGQMPELQRVLAKEGVSLNHMDVGSHTDSSQQQASSHGGDSASDRPERPAPPSRSSTPSAVRTPTGLLHVKA